MVDRVKSHAGTCLAQGRAKRRDRRINLPPRRIEWQVVKIDDWVDELGMGFEWTTCGSHDVRKPIIRQEPFKDMATDKAGRAGDQDTGHHLPFEDEGRTVFTAVAGFVGRDTDVVSQ